jgi:hypothetical protein
MQAVLYGLSEYWAVGFGEDWLDNFRAFGNSAATGPVTNVVTIVTVALTGFQGADTASPVKMDNRGILACLNGTLTDTNTGAQVVNNFIDGAGNPVNDAKLIFVHTEGSDGESKVKVRQTVNRTNIVDTDVSPWLQLRGDSPVGAPGQAVYEIGRLSMDNGRGISFGVDGFARISKGPLSGIGAASGVHLPSEIKAAIASVSGSGNLPLAPGASDSYSVLRGSIMLSRAVVEVR